MKFSGDKLIVVTMPENAAGGSRKAALALFWSRLMGKTGEILKICVRCNLIMPAASGSMNTP